MLSRIVLFLVLCGTWLVLSGFFSPFFIVVGLLSCMAATALFIKISKTKSEKNKLANILLRLPFYMVWLTKEVVMSSLSVSKKMWQLEPEISPDLVWIPTIFRDDLSLTLLGNSITLTPGTLTTIVRDDGLIQVHALNRESIEAVREIFLDKVAKLTSEKGKKA